jgi:hypothetical protein
MADENLPGTAPTAEQPEPSSGPPAEPQTPQEPTPTPASPVGGGKTLEQLSQEVEEQARLVQDANNRAARAEHDAMLQRNLIEQLGLQRARKQEEVLEVPEVSDDEFLTNPAKATSKIIEGYFVRDRKEREREKVEQYVNTARTAYESGKSEAIKANPNLYRGIETDLSREIFTSIQSSLKSGQPVDVSAIRNPRYWEAAAIAMRIMNGEDVSKYYRHSTPMTPSHTETPTAGLPPKAEMTLTPEQEEIISKGNITREQFMEAWKKERGITEGRNR